jgi:PAP2 superfamily
VEYGVALLVGFMAGFKFPLPTDTYALLTSVIAATALVLILLTRLAIYAIAGERHPAGRLLADAQLHAPWLISIAITFFLVGLQIAALTWLKTMLPIAGGFWADPFLAQADKAMLGQDAWVRSHMLFGPMTWIDRVYVTWMPVKLATLLIIILLPLSEARSRALLSYFLIMASGSLGQYLLPSGGPIFYEQLGLGSRFHALPVEPWVAAARDYLWAEYLHPQSAIGAGISAMPSMHVAIALWVALVLKTYLKRWQWVGWAWFAAIFVGSIHLGWHYALDSIAAALIAVIAWQVAQRFTSPEIRGARATFPIAPESARG